MARKKEVVKPPALTEEERAAVQSLFYDTCLLGVHPVVIANVREKLGDLLRLIGRADLGELVDDWDKLLGR